MNKSYKNVEQIDNKIFPIKLTSKAIQAAKVALKNLKNTKKENIFLRIAVNGGGCSGLKYILNFVKEINDFDLITKQDDLFIAIDTFSVNYLINTIIDYIKNDDVEGFKFNNPNAKKSCNCPSNNV